jgi:hypothetical protein
MGIMDLPKRWDAVIRQKGDYIAGLQHFTAHLVFLFSRYCVMCIYFEMALVINTVHLVGAIEVH